MSDIAGTHDLTSGTRPTPRTDPPAHEAYAFACMRCGHGWEQAYEITHHVDAEGRTHCVYHADGARVPSPLTRPVCLNCGGTLVRIMRAGQVSEVSAAMAGLHQRRDSSSRGKNGRGGRGGRGQGTQEAADGVDNASVPAQDGQARDVPAQDGAGKRDHHWHLADLLHPFQHHRLQHHK
ncbi:hypothetical protein [Streptomyces sp. NPDC003077]|uniref:hypothetical protein n=1 Tax=Streptomyces sp. NPDC003077 TaxID=3154443 RepID=UPI0033AB38A9